MGSDKKCGFYSGVRPPLITLEYNLKVYFKKLNKILQSEGRYQADNMEKFFTDFHKAQQLRVTSAGAPHLDRPRYPHNMLSAERLEMEHKQRYILEISIM